MLVSLNVVVILEINDLKLVLLSEISDARTNLMLSKYSLKFSAVVFASFISILSINYPNSVVILANNAYLQ